MKLFLIPRFNVHYLLRNNLILNNLLDAEVGLDPKPLTILGGSEKTKGDVDESIYDSEEITSIVGKTFMTGHFMDLHPNWH